MSLRPVRVLNRHLETPNIVALTLADPDGQPLPPYTAGAHIDLELGRGMTRQYSLCRRYDEKGVYTIGVLRDPVSRGGSIAVHQLAIGDRVNISAPRNAFALTPGRHPTVLLAGGIGVTPLICMAETLHAEGHPFVLHYCARSLAQAAFLSQLQEGPFAEHVIVHLDDGPSGQHLDVDRLLSELDRSTHLYICGPSGFIDWSLDAAKRAAWPDSQLHREYFTAAPATASSGDTGFIAKIDSSGRLIPVAANQTLAWALNDNGVHLPVSCSSGVCGTCLTGVLEGLPDHRDYYLTEDEKARGDVILPCCSRSKTPLLVLAL